MRARIIVWLCLVISPALATDFSEVVARPELFNHKVVSIVGLALLNGDAFYLFEDVSAASTPDMSRAVYIQHTIHRSFLEQYNDRWVRVTGTVKATIHGPYNAFPCEIRLQKVKILNRPPEKLWPRDVGEFKNETEHAVRVRLYDRAESYYASFSIGPGGINSTALRRDTVAVVSSIPDESHILKTKLPIPPRSRTKDEPAERILRYRIDDGVIRLVTDTQAK
jgi:hypothetical protein